jgi:hypothetical protein
VSPGHVEAESPVLIVHTCYNSTGSHLEVTPPFLPNLVSSQQSLVCCSKKLSQGAGLLGFLHAELIKNDRALNKNKPAKQKLMEALMSVVAAALQPQNIAAGVGPQLPGVNGLRISKWQHPLIPTLAHHNVSSFFYSLKDQLCGTVVHCPSGAPRRSRHPPPPPRCPDQKWWKPQSTAVTQAAG